MHSKCDFKKKIQNGLVVFILLLFWLPSMPRQEETVEHKPLKYDVKVNVLVVPVFAVDSKGQPVYDLEEGDVALYVNGQPCKIAQFKRYEFDSQKEVTREVTVDEKKEDLPGRELAPPREGRVIFVILDSMFTDMTGFRRSREITEELVKNSSPGDHFVILENRPEAGLKYIAGPDPKGKDLLKKIRNIKAPIEIGAEELYRGREMMQNVNFDSLMGAEEQQRAMKSVRTLIKDSEKMRYRNMLSRFSHVLSQFKYALKTINKPKMVFLISEGPQKGAFKDEPSSRFEAKPDYRQDTYIDGDPSKGIQKRHKYASMFKHSEKTVGEQNKVFSAFLFDYLKDIIKAINKGGSVLYTINPRRLSDTFEDDTSGDEGLNYMASESGGKYFAGNDAKIIVKQVKTTTAAYYELVFAPKPQMGENIRIDVKSNRPDVRVHTLNFAEREKPYAKMEKVQKKIFALNVVKGGSWSRMVGKVVRVKYKKKKKDKEGDEKSYTIEVYIPPKMQDQSADIFTFRVNPRTHKVNIGMVNTLLKERGEIRLSGKKNEDLYFAIIEPKNTYTVYNQVK